VLAQFQALFPTTTTTDDRAAANKSNHDASSSSSTKTGQFRYAIAAGGGSAFRIDSLTGELFRCFYKKTIKKNIKNISLFRYSNIITKYT
jgi:hypothetical protein